MYKLILFICVFFISSAVILSQEKNQPKATDATDTVSSMSSVIVDTTNKNNPKQIAKEMSVNLLERLNLSLEQADKIEDILVDYQSDIAEAERKQKTNIDESDKSGKDITGGEERNALSEIDEQANQKIEDTMDNAQLSSYIEIKKSWWNEVKDRIHGKNESKDQNNIKTDTLNNK